MLIPVQNIKNFLISKLGEPDNEEALDQYITFIIENEVKYDTDLYCENHHILPQCIEPNDITVKLKYNDHCDAHLYLFLAYNRNDFHRPLNFMKPDTNIRGKEYSEGLSIARKRGMEKFKNSDKYEEYLEQCKIKTSLRMKDGLAAELSKRRFDQNPNARQEISEHFKQLWADPEYKKRVKESMVAERNTSEGKARMSNAANDRWDCMSVEEREKFSLKMQEVNNDIDKRVQSGIAIKEKWADPNFRDKMKNRKHGSNSTSLKEKWADPEWKAMMLANRKLAKERKTQNETR
jgi:hypothetical protein